MIENVVVAWFVYAVWGLISALLQGEKFDPYKLSKSFLWAIIVVVVALLTGLPPELALSEYNTLIEQVLVFVMNSGAAITLIWFIDRFYNAISGIRARIADWFGVKKA